MSEPITEQVTEPPGEHAVAAKKSRRAAVITLAVIGVLIIAAVGITIAVRAGQTPAKMTVTGTIAVPASQNDFYQSQADVDVITKPGSSDCRTDAGAADIPGSQVTVTDASGKTVGVGTVGPATWAVSPTYRAGATATGGACSMSFAIPDVTKGSSYYSIALTGHGSVKFTAAQMGQPLALDLQ